MSTLQLPPEPDLGQLRKQAKELARRVRAGDPAAVASVAEHTPNLQSHNPTLPLSAAQLVVARTYGFASWARLKRHVEDRMARTRRPDAAAPCDDVTDEFLRLACLTYGADHPDRRAAAAALLSAAPDLPDRNLHVAAACAAPDAVRAHLADDLGQADMEGGPHRWSPLLYLAYARHDPAVTETAALTTARLLLDAGADPNAGFLWHGMTSPFTVLTGVFGEGEGGAENQPRHPHALALARLLLERGADPNDGQALYNRTFGTDDSHLELLFEFGLGSGDGGPWRAVLGDALDSPSSMLATQLYWAVTHHRPGRVRLLLDNGIDPDTAFPDDSGPLWRRHKGRRAVELAALAGDDEIVSLLLAAGAAPPQPNGVDQLLAAIVTGDRDGVDRLRRSSPRVVDDARDSYPGFVVRAAVDGGAEAVRLAVAVGFDVDGLARRDTLLAEPWESALHHAAAEGDLNLARALLDLGADPNVRDARFDSPPLGWARHFGHTAVADLLEPLTQA